MIAKIEVRRQLALYEKKIEEEIASIREEINNMYNLCKNSKKIQEVWYESKDYIKLDVKLRTLQGVLLDIIDMRCSEILEDSVNS